MVACHLCQYSTLYMTPHIAKACFNACVFLKMCLNVQHQTVKGKVRFPSLFAVGMIGQKGPCAC